MESPKGTLSPTDEEVSYVSVTKTLNLQKLISTAGGFENGQEIDFERKDGSIVHLNIKVSWGDTIDDKLTSLDVDSWDTIGDVKVKFQHKEGTPANQLILFYDGRQLDDLQTLSGYNIGNHSTIDAFSLGEDKIVILVHSLGQDPTEVMVNLCSTVVNLKRMIHCMGNDAVGRQKLTFNGVVLENGQRLLDYNIQMGSELYLEFSRRTDEMHIFLWTLEGVFCTICADSSDTVATLKTEIRYKKGIPEERLNLIFAGKTLKNDHTLRDCNIKNECSLYMAFRLCDRCNWFDVCFPSSI